MSQRLSLSCRLVKDGHSDNVQVHLNQMDSRGKDKDACGTVRMNVELVGEDELRYGQFGRLVVVPAKLQSGRTRDVSVSLIGTVG
ncbi:hypothetical protein F2Q70_00031727 [Brassica cretica]|uniref:Uncharacterized protein n=1 Tax=Brassica cretica TaxID=69181 RepID=A0A8S9FIQ1_BRACR|nr:hypothetical protein F2Q70_00031727 [Brassica cretica]